MLWHLKISRGISLFLYVCFIFDLLLVLFIQGLLLAQQLGITSGRARMRVNFSRPRVKHTLSYLSGTPILLLLLHSENFTHRYHMQAPTEMTSSGTSLHLYLHPNQRDTASLSLPSGHPHIASLH